MEGWVKIYSTGNEIEADFIVGLLQSSEIEVQSISKKDSWNKFDVFANSQVDIYVPKEQADEAKLILETKPEDI
ncbi:MAG: DUF2007 domain-containing protein [Candidatus Kapabacteria bacterium]|nr:DUF2007 domain-containing protein [Candidatus Kapabacteria bacterium]